MKVLIDNGHGENTPGKRSPDGRLREWVYSREIADMVVPPFDIVRFHTAHDGINTTLKIIRHIANAPLLLYI